MRNLIEKPLWLGDPSTSLRVTLVSLSFRTNVRNLIEKPLELGDPSTSLRVTGSPFDFAQGDNGVIPLNMTTQKS